MNGRVVKFFIAFLSSIAELPMPIEEYYILSFAVAGYLALVIPMVRAFGAWVIHGTPLPPHVTEQVIIWMSAVMVASGYHISVDVLFQNRN